MKKYNNIFKALGLIFVFVLILSSCSKWIDTDINIDPDSPADVPMKLMLPAIEQSMGYNMTGNDIVRVSNMWMQQFDGVVRQSNTQAEYTYLPADINNTWTSIYAEIFINSKVLIDKAENTEGKVSPYYAGIGKVIMATTLGIATDVFGDMPYSEALKGNENILTPSYDSQETLYSTINSTLTAAIADLSATANAVAVAGDVIYAGNVAKWKKAAYSIKARHALQLGGVNGNAAYTAALDAAANGFASNADDYQVPWEASNRNPIFQFMEQRTDIRMGATLVDMMKLTNDPRIPFYCAKDGAGAYSGSIIGSLNENASKPGNYIAGATASSVIMTYAELKFIQAEANFRLGNTAPAQAAFEAAVAASVLKVTGSANASWLAANITGVPVTLELIMKQKYIATFGTNQAYADYRRTGLPAITPHPRGVLPAVPTRFPYAQSEINYNSANVPSVQISDKLWWDR
ncbi:MAG: SusD/RagB family nutrient-binding outer membrane lipoprotein [Bacteroidetes bacterium]|nr:SusD/RagB family nutrient-binding outer membrane lipoprotein [Bacteroidota bacterium]